MLWHTAVRPKWHLDSGNRCHKACWCVSLTTERTATWGHYVSAIFRQNEVSTTCMQHLQHVHQMTLLLHCTQNTKHAATMQNRSQPSRKRTLSCCSSLL